MIKVEEDRSGVGLGIDEELEVFLIGVVFGDRMPKMLVKG